MTDERIVNRFSLDDPDWDLLLCDLPEDEPEDDRSERWLAETPTANTLR